MYYLKFSLILLWILFASCNTAMRDVTKPPLFEFGATMEQMVKKLTPGCDSTSERKNEPIQLPTAVHSQSQLVCMGFMYAGKKRKVELVFADDVLDMVWILTEPEEEELFIEKFTARYGEPTHQKGDVTFFLDNGVAVRNDPHEILFISDRLKEPYRQWLNTSN